MDSECTVQGDAMEGWMVLGSGRVGGWGDSPGGSSLDGGEGDGGGVCRGVGGSVALGWGMGRWNDVVCSEGTGEGEERVGCELKC